MAELEQEQVEDTGMDSAEADFDSVDSGAEVDTSSDMGEVEDTTSVDASSQMEEYQAAVAERFAQMEAERKQEREELLGLLKTQLGNQQQQVDPMDEFGDLDPEERKRLDKIAQTVRSPLEKDLQEMRAVQEERERSLAIEGFKSRWSGVKDYPLEKIAPHINGVYEKISSGKFGDKLDMAGLAVIGALHMENLRAQRSAQVEAAKKKKASAKEGDVISRSTTQGRVAGRGEGESKREDPVQRALRQARELEGHWINSALK